ncbi:hypothetical protein HMSSN139_54840 [Paenibacillus sp. HMSSN-139]|nr:hypothetical protein HMSSN139_54840 [Paenibacillus sp. HMSSN-139]
MEEIIVEEMGLPGSVCGGSGNYTNLSVGLPGCEQQAIGLDPASVTDTVNLSGEEEAATEEGTKEEEATEVIASSEDLSWPVANAADVAVVKPFYEKEGTAEEHQAALVQYNDTFTPNTGIDLAREDRKPFEVTAAMSGKVTRVEEVPLLGFVVEITHANNLKTVYESLGEVKVKKDAEVKQGDTIGSAGRNEIEKDLDNHVHFAIYENGELVNPETVLPKN